jgi:hypothetical protein
MDLDEESAHRLHMKYLTEYGLAIRGLSQHHAIGTDHPNGSNSAIVARLNGPYYNYRPY